MTTCYQKGSGRETVSVMLHRNLNAGRVIANRVCDYIIRPWICGGELQERVRA